MKSKSILTALYNGEINPSERKKSKGEEQSAIEKNIQSLKDYFKKGMTEEDYKNLEELEELYCESSEIDNVDAFAYGFTMGALFLVEIMVGKEVSINAMN